MMKMMRTGRDYGHVLTDALRDLGPETRIVDVREPDEYTGELGHIPGAELVPLDQLAEAAEGWDRAKPLLVVCERGARSIYAAARLASIGFHEVGSLVGGMLAYRDSGFPIAV